MEWEVRTESGIVVYDLSFEAHGIARKHLRHEPVHKLMLLVDVRLTFYQHPGDHDWPARWLKAIGASKRDSHVESHMPA